MQRLRNDRKGLIKEYADLFNFDSYKDAVVEMEGFGEKSFQNLADSVEKARHTTPVRLLYALGIPESAWPMQIDR